MQKSWNQVLVAAVALSAAAQLSYAGYSTIAPPYEGEQSTTQILNHTYSDTFQQSGVNFFGSRVDAYRIQDTVQNASKSSNGTTAPPTPLDLGSGITTGQPGSGIGANPLVTATDPTDQYWSGNSVVAVAQARFAMYNQDFGYMNGAAGGTYHPILDVTGSEYDVSGSGLVGGLNGNTFRFSRTGENATFSSRNDDNPNGIDHMVTYQIVPKGEDPSSVSRKVYMLFWDDKLPSDDADYDYNDLAVEIVVSTDAVPEPTSLGLIGAGAGMLMRRRRSVVR